jgi:Putative beta-barrel porin 2
LLTLLSSTAVPGQEDKLLPIQLGRFFLYPSVGFAYLYESNVQRANQEDPNLPQISSSSQDLRPAFRIELPFEQSSMSLQYAARIREYRASQLQDASGTSHYVDFGGRFQMAQSFRLDVADHYLKGISELQKIDPGGELRFGAQPFRSNDADAVLTYQMDPIHSVEAGANVSEVRFDATDSSGIAYASHSNGFYARYLVGTNPETQYLFSADWRGSSQSRSSVDIAPGEYVSRSLGIGMRRRTGPDTASEVRLGYGTVNSPGSSLQSFKGIMAEGDINRRLGALTTLTVKLRRTAQTSYFNTNVYYINEMLGLGFERELGRRIRIQMAAAFQHNSYPAPVQVQVEPGEEAFDQNQDGILDAYAYLVPSEGIRRKDRLEGESLKVLIKLGRPLGLEVGMSRSHARSNILAEYNGIRYRIFNYDYQAVTASFIVGWN